MMSLKEGGDKQHQEGLPGQDCYFFLNSSCSRGHGCPYRHEPAALGNEIVCTYWRAGNCRKQHCSFRHMELPEKKNQIPALANETVCTYWKAGNCRKQQCSFRHMEDKKNKLPAHFQETVCTFWKAGNCSKPNCSFRHMEDRKGREMTRCYWETKSRGCSNPSCIFLHQNTKTPVKDSVSSSVSFQNEDDNWNCKRDLPPPCQKMTKNEGACVVVVRFLKEYFRIYDSSSRQPLLDAYHSEAVMSLSCSGRRDLLTAYIQESRNLTRVVQEGRRHALLRRGGMQVVAFLSQLPSTSHDMATFTLDLPLASASLLTFTVTGLFKERDTMLKESVRHFNRCFIVVPQGAGLSIINETLYISSATALGPPSPTAFSAPLPVVAPPVLSLAARQAMAVRFSSQSGLNLEWAARCLEDNNWDFDKSIVAFTEAKTASKIPAEAFDK